VVEITVDNQTLSLEVRGWDKLWAFKSRLEIPLANIRTVTADPSIARELWKGLRAPGTHVPGVIVAGTFHKDGKRVFWDVHNPDNTIAIGLADDRYDQLIVEVQNPANAVSLIEGALESRDA